MIIIFIIFFAENELTELVTGEDLEITLEEQKYLEDGSKETHLKKSFSALRELIWPQN